MKTAYQHISRRALLAGLGATLTFGASRTAAAAAEDWAEVQAAALKEGTLSFYHNLRPQGVEQLLIAFRKANPGIQTEQTARKLAAIQGSTTIPDGPYPLRYDYQPPPSWTEADEDE